MEIDEKALSWWLSLPYPWRVNAELMVCKHISKVGRTADSLSNEEIELIYTKEVNKPS